MFTLVRRNLLKNFTTAVLGIMSSVRTSNAANIVVICDPTKEYLQELMHLPKEASVSFTGIMPSDFETPKAKQALSSATILFNCGGSRDLLISLWASMPNLKWMHNWSTGVDNILFKELIESDLCLTNSRGTYSNSLAEHVILSILYFSKDVDRWKKNQREKNWDRFLVQEARGQTLGIIGYGDIGQSSARLAKALGMRVIALRRRISESVADPLVDELYTPEQVGELISKSDYVCISAALTSSTKGMVGKKEIEKARPHTVFINVGRGPIIDEKALIEALQGRLVRGASLDVFENEPLPQDSPLWSMDNVLLSPHNADMTATFLHDCVRLFAVDVGKFMMGEKLNSHIVDKRNGY